VSNVFEDITCAGCYCVCDDIQVTTDGQQIIDVQTTCPQGQAWFEQARQSETLQPQIGKDAVSREDALARAAELLLNANAPLVFGMNQSATDAQRAAVSLADRLGATIDSGATAATRALQQVGEASCTLGEVRSRADLILYWDAEELRLNEKHRQSLAAGEPALSRKIVTLGTTTTAQSQDIDCAVTVPEEGEIDLIWRLRALLKGIDLDGPEPTGLSIPEMQQLVSLIQQSRYMVCFYGSSWKQGTLAHRKLEALSLLVREIQAERRCHALSVPAAGQTKGAEPVLAWQTGYAAAVNFAAGYPRFAPCESTTIRMLEKAEADVCLLIGADPLAGLAEAALNHLKQIPLIQVGSARLKDIQPDVYLPAGISGIHHAGSLYRFDGTPLPLRALIAAPQLSEAEIIAQLENLLTTS